MRRTIGVLAAEHVAVGLVENNKLVDSIRIFPEAGNKSDYLEGMPAEEIVSGIAQQIEIIVESGAIDAVGVGFPGIIRDGIAEDSPNLAQVKGQNLREALTNSLHERGITAPVHIINDADAMAAGLAATRGHLDKVLRVWWLGTGVGYGYYPHGDSVGEGGHTVVTLDPKEKFCGCGGIGHLEGIMGYRSMRLRFMDLEPEEIFDAEHARDVRCSGFVKLWHRALAAATANSIHMDGPGKFFISGPNARFVQIGLVELYLHEMVKMSPLQDNTLEVVSTNDETAIIGAAVNAERASLEP